MSWQIVWQILLENKRIIYTNYFTITESDLGSLITMNGRMNTGNIHFGHNVTVSTPRTKPNFPSWSTWLTTTGLMAMFNKCLLFSQYYIGNSCQKQCFNNILSLGKNQTTNCSFVCFFVCTKKQTNPKKPFLKLEISLHWLNTSFLIAFRIMPRLMKKNRLSNLRAHSPMLSK